MQEWLQKKPEELNRCRGGRVESGGLEVSFGTALHWAAFYGKIEIAKLLLDHGASTFTADLHIPVAWKEMNQSRHFSLCISYMHSPVVYGVGYVQSCFIVFVAL